MKRDRFFKNIVSYKKHIMCILFIIIVWLTMFSDLGLSNTFIYPIAEQAVKNRMPIVIILVLVGVMGLFYKSKSAYYSLFFNIELVSCSFVFISRNITKSFNPNCFISYVITIIFSISFIGIYCIKDKLSPQNNQKQQNNPFEPINKVEKLFPSRRSQMNELISIIKSQISDNGYTICISSEWGSGKTSFINAVLDEFKTNNNLNYKVDEIRINAMELDDTESLLNYLFGRIKEILKSNGIYVGINSEYQELIVSFLETATNETTGNFIRNKFLSISDYREKLLGLSRLIENELDEKIVIVIDDLERCQKDKIKEFLYFIKEISVIHRCIIVFLTDCNKLKSNSEFSMEFLEKFFNYIINLHPVNDDEIITYSINDNNFFNLLDDIKGIYEKEIEMVTNQRYFGTEDAQENEKRKDERIKSLTENYEIFLDKVRNPRRVQKIYQKYEILLKITTDQEKIEQAGYPEFINKVDYKKQILILSLLYNFSPEKYEIIETKGIMEFIDAPQIYEKNSDIYFFIDVLFREWNPLISDYITKEKMRFISCLIFTPNELPKIANGFTSIQEEYISFIKNNKKPVDITLDGVLEELFIAKFNTEEERKSCIEHAFLLYTNEIIFDDAIKIISKISMIRRIAEDNDIFYVICNAIFNLRLENIEYCLNCFSKFASDYLYIKLNSFTRFVSLLSSEIVEYRSYESVLTSDSIDNMIISYCKRVNMDFNLKLDFNEQNTPVEKLKLIYIKAKEYCIDKNIIDCCDIDACSNCLNANNLHNFPDVDSLCIKSKEVIECIEYLYKIERYINSVEKTQSNKFIPIGKNFDKDYSKELDKLIEYLEKYDDSKDLSFDNRSMQLLWISINNLFHNMVDYYDNISEEDLKKVNIVIEAYYKTFEDSPTPWRQLYLQMQEKIMNQNQIIH